MTPFVDSITRELRGVCELLRPPAGCEFSKIKIPDDFVLGGNVALVLSANGESWIPVNDRRGQIWHEPESGSEITITTLNQELPASYVQGPAPTVPDSSALVADLLAALAAHRYAIETAGIHVDGRFVLTELSDQARITATLKSFESEFFTAVNWKGPGGWETLTYEQFLPIARGVAQHVQACFSAERVVCDQIKNLPESELAGFDVAAAWDSVFQTEMELPA